VIGNPPYIGFHGFKNEKEYLIKEFITTKGKFDIYLPFIEKAFLLLKNEKYLGYICPTNFLKRGHGFEIRELIAKNKTIIEICNFQHQLIFKGATNYTGIFIFRNSKPEDKVRFLYKDGSINDPGIYIIQDELNEKPWILGKSEIDTIIKRVYRSKNIKLSELTSGISEGIVTGKNDVFILKKEFATNLNLESELLRPCIRGKDIQKYIINEPDEVVIYPYKVDYDKTVPLSTNEMQNYSAIWEYLNQKRDFLKGRKYFDKSKKQWYELWCQRKIFQFENLKIVVPEISDKNRFAIDTNHLYYGDTVCGISINSKFDLKIEYILGILNSKLIETYYKNVTVPKAGGYFIYKTMFLKNIPIRFIDISDPSDKALHDRMVSLVETMLTLHKRLPEVKTPQEKETIQRQIDVTDAQIDKMVYELYGLTEEEIALVEKM